MKPKHNSPVASLPLSLELIKRRIFIVRGQEIMIDGDLAELYQVPTFRLNESVKRNRSRFPEDFMFQLTKEEAQNLTSQFAISSLRSQNAILKRGQHRKYLPHAFTEHGVAMLSSVLKSKRAILMNIFIIRAFIQLRKMLIQHESLSRRVQKTEKVIKFHDEVLLAVVEDVKKLKNPRKINAIGFHWKPKTKI
jgi:hypothetical protein